MMQLTFLKRLAGAPVRLVLAGALAMTGAVAQGDELALGWSLEPAMSNIRFQSVKNETKVESSSFATFSGGIEADGSARVSVLLDSVDTKIDLRNVRMRFLFFETFRHPEAVVTTMVDPAYIADLASTRRKTVTLPFALDLHGIKKTLLAEVAVTLLTDDMVSVASAAPISIDVAEFGFSENIAKLEEAAGGISILPSATVTFDFIFKRRSGNAPQEVATTPSQIVPATVALESEGDFSRDACEGRFEILSRTGNIYFRTGSARLDNSSMPLLDSLVDIVARCPELNIEVAGHTDADGSNAANQALSEARARSVAAYLAQQGIAADRLVAMGYGETQPVAPNDTAEGKRKNRRIAFTVLTN